MIHSLQAPFSVGRYLLSPQARRHSPGQYQASISIRSGCGSATHDRIYRFVGVFRSAACALRYAADQGPHLLPV